MDTGIDVRAALEQLDGKDRKLYQMILSKYGLRSYAEEEQTTEAAVKMRAMRMRRKVKKTAGG
jgi:transposase-like protein